MKARKKININAVGSLERNKYTYTGCSNKVSSPGKCFHCEAKAIKERNKDYQKLCDKKKYIK